MIVTLSGHVVIINNTDDILRLILDEIERRENSLLVWGVVDGSSSETEILAVISDIIDDNWKRVEEIDDRFTDTGFVLKKLTEKCLIFEIPFTDDQRQFRSRMAETVRLLFHLRQLFPLHDRVGGYNAANTLVADYRFKRVSRSYPKRDQTLSDFFEVLCAENPNIRAALEAQSERRPGIERFMLANFQVEATKAILDSIATKNDQGILISAGTGSGKTLAFYLPALSRISDLIQQEDNTDRWVKAVAIYPRNELLKDQFREVFTEARLLDDLLKAKNKRKIQIGALFGPTPNSSGGPKYKDDWIDDGAGYICPYINCIQCGGLMVWRHEDLRRNREVLCCQGDECDFEINEDEIILTRKRIAKSPPDILFTSTEMMNRHLSNKILRSAFGAFPHAQRAPEMMLLDEVHTYQSFTGAQIAFLLRRWRNALPNGSDVTFIGLSATLKDGEVFFAELCGLSADNVTEIKPRPSEMEKEGAEYTIALRGDPVSRAALLSTTIQTGMLLSRTLDERNSRVSDGIFGTKLFAFTDKLDVINRLEPDMLDAEGRDRDGTPLRKPPLAFLRQPQNDKTRYTNGQDWLMCRQIGHFLDNKKNISKTTSQDPGVNLEAEVIIATSTLEVGFNETNVGAVIQHKAPRGMASYVQRKGRAGRTRKMRPWTAIVLSDYGRDRLIYMAYEQLFDPELPANSLPIGNRYISRIQAVYCLIEYLSKEVGNIWSGRPIRKWLSQPYEPDNREETLKKERLFHKKLREILTNILEDTVVFDDFSSYLGKSLQLQNDEIQAILWDHPRPLITAVIPTALRRLATNWKNENGDEDHYLRDAPLPEFATQTLFNDLNLPEVILKMPEQQLGDDETMALSQAMREFAPGRISKRFAATGRANLKHWVCPEDLTENECLLEFTNPYELSELGRWSLVERSDVVSLPVFRLLSIQLKQADPDYGDTSNARLNWHTQIIARERGTPLAPPVGVPLEQLIEDIQIFTHEDQNPVEIRRFSDHSNADIRRPKEEDFRTRINFVRDGVPAALGMSMTVDALRIKIPSSFNFLDNLNLTEAAIRGLRTARYLSEAKTGETLSAVANPFLKEWLANIYMTTVIHQAILTSTNLEVAAEEVFNDASELLVTQVLNTVFQSYHEVDPDADDEAEPERDTLHVELNHLLTTPDIRQDLHNLISLLWTDIDESWNTWLRDKVKVTLAGAVYYTIQTLCPQIDIENLTTDIFPGPREVGDVFVEEDINYEIWVSETSPGGNGLIQTFNQSFNEEPGLFFKLLHSTLEANEFEVIDRQMTRYLNESEPTASSSLYDSVEEYRSADSLDQQEASFTEIRRSLVENGYSIFHSFLSSFSARIMRPGSSDDSDHFFRLGITEWIEEEERLGTEIDARIFSYYWSQTDAAENFMASFDTQNTGTHDRNWLYNVIYGVFWPRGRLVRESSLKLYNEFVELPDPERLLFANLSRVNPKTVQCSSQDWLEETKLVLQEEGTVIVESSVKEQKDLSKAINQLAVEPIEVSYLKSFARIIELDRSEEVIRARFELPEIFW
ncbi:protein DpdJ [Rhodospirillales bacterium]|nr:protein DpdJ [Rhodospirillales bacterium]